MNELIQDTVSSIPVLLTDGAGGLVTGAIKAQVDPYYRKSGGAYAQLVAAQFDWAEEDAVHCPGEYTLTINAVGVAAGVLDTLGDFRLRIQASLVVPTFVAYPFIGDVVPLYSWDSLLRSRALAGANYRLFPTAWDAVSGEVTAATMRTYRNSADAAGNVNWIEEFTLTATYDALGRVTSYITTV